MILMAHCWQPGRPARQNLAAQLVAVSNTIANPPGFGHFLTKMNQMVHCGLERLAALMSY